MNQALVGVEGGLGGVVVVHQPEVAEEAGAGRAGIAQRVMDVVGDVEGLGVAGYHAEDGAEDFGLACVRAAWPGGPAVFGDDQRQVAQPGRIQSLPAMLLKN